ELPAPTPIAFRAENLRNPSANRLSQHHAGRLGVGIWDLFGFWSFSGAWSLGLGVSGLTNLAIRNPARRGTKPLKHGIAGILDLENSKTKPKTKPTVLENHERSI